jgi:hypothetical protein
LIDDAERVAAAVATLPPAVWRGGWPDLPSCVVDAVFSVGSRYEATVLPMLQRWRPTSSAVQAGTLTALLQEIDGVDGAAVFARHVLRNRQRTSTRSGILKAEAVHRAARSLTVEMIQIDQPTIETVDDLLAAPDLGASERAWRAVQGQGSGVTWRYLLMLAGVPGVKPDRMILRFVTRVLDRPIGREEAIVVVTAAAECLGLTSTQADHVIWASESRQRAPKRR